MKVKNVMFSGFAAAVLAFACNSADAAVKLATQELVNTKQAKLDNTNVTTTGEGAVVTGVTATDGVVTVAHGDLAVADVTGLQAALNEKQVKLSVEDGSAIKISESGLISLEGLASDSDLSAIQNALKDANDNIVSQTSQDEKISALEAKVGNTTVTEAITDALEEGEYVKKGNNVSLLTNDAGYITNAALTDYTKTADLGGLALKSTVTNAELDSGLQAAVSAANSAVQPETLNTTLGSYVTNDELTQMGYAVASEVNTALANKQATITDLETIRTGAKAGATAVQQQTLTTTLSSYVTSEALEGKGYATTEYVDDAETDAVNTAKGYTDDSVAERVKGTLPVENGTYLVSSNGQIVTWTEVEVIGANGSALELTSTETGANSGVKQ